MGKVITFPNKLGENEFEAAKRQAIEFIENCNDDFCLIVKTDDIKHLFEEADKMTREYIIASTNREDNGRVSIKNQANGYYFFKL